MTGDLISREEAIELIRSLSISIGGKEIFHPEVKKSVIEALDLSPTVDAVPVLHGRWIRQDNTYTRYMCSECESTNHDGHEKFCPNCGAKMDLE